MIPQYVPFKLLSLQNDPPLQRKNPTPFSRDILRSPTSTTYHIIISKKNNHGITGPVVPHDPVPKDHSRFLEKRPLQDHTSTWTGEFHGEI